MLAGVVGQIEVVAPLPPGELVRREECVDWMDRLVACLEERSVTRACGWFLSLPVRPGKFFKLRRTRAFRRRFDRAKQLCMHAQRDYLITGAVSSARIEP
jgi:hypothetical protein